MIKNKKLNENRKVFVTFSNQAFQSNPKFYYDFIDIIESNCGFEVPYRWFKESIPDPPKKIYRNSLLAIRTADICIAEASSGSIGVGQQISYAIQHKKLVVICLKKELEKTNKHFFLKGTTSPTVSSIYYESLADLKKILCDKLNSSYIERLEKFNFLATVKEKKVLYQQSLKQDISQSELLRNIIDEWIEKNKIDSNSK